MKRAADAWRSYAAGSELAHFAKFCREHLIQSEDRWEGKPLVLEPWQRRMMGEALAFDSDGFPTWRSVVIVAPRKNGKTALLSAIALYRLLTADGRPEILLAASSDKQAGRLFDAAARFVRRSEELSALLRVRDHAGEIAREDGMGIVYRLSSDPGRIFGYTPSVVICDELAMWTTPQLRRAYAALTSGGGARSAPQVWTITTAAEAAQRHDSILGRLLDAAHDAEGIEREPGLTVCRLSEARTLVFEYAAPTTDPRDVNGMKLANPASWITKTYLRRQAETRSSPMRKCCNCTATCGRPRRTRGSPPLTGALASTANENLRMARGGPQLGGTAVRAERSRRPADVDREGVQGGRDPRVLAARSPSPANQPAPPAGRPLGADRRAGRATQLAVTANTYSHVLVDEAELDYARVLA